IPGVPVHRAARLGADEFGGRGCQRGRLRRPGQHRQQQRHAKGQVTKAHAELRAAPGARGEPWLRPAKLTIYANPRFALALVQGTPDLSPLRAMADLRSRKSSNSSTRARKPDTSRLSVRSVGLREIFFLVAVGIFAV